MNTNILFTDIVGYSKLTGDDQSLALELLNEHDKIIEPIISRYSGKIVKRIGDAIVAIFDDSKNMVQTSIEIQQSLKNRNNRNIKSRHLILRIGLHYGDVTIKNNEVYGKGYDLASEIEPICEYGGIAISDTVYSQVSEDNELIIQGVNNNFFINPIAEFNFKSQSSPVLIYKLYLNLLDWYDELYTDASKYLSNQHISDDKYNINNLKDYYSSNLDVHLDLAESFLNKHNLSYAIYHYKIYLDYSTKPSSDIELKILKIFAECGLIRLVNKTFKNNNFGNNNLVSLIQGINLLNQKSWDDAINKFETFLYNDSSDFLIDGFYYLITTLFKQNKYDSIIKLIDSKKKHINQTNIHAFIIPIIKEIALFKLNNNNDDIIIKLSSKFDNYLASLDKLIEKKYALFLYYPLLSFHQHHTTIENAINIQNQATTVIKECESAISGFLLRQLFLKNPILHQIIMEPLALEFIEDEGLDEYNLDDIFKEVSVSDYSETKQKENSKICTTCDAKNSIKFQFCISCGGKFIS